MLAESGNKIVEVLTEEMKVQEIIHIPVIHAGKLGDINFSITNAVIYMWVSAIIVFLFFFIAAKRSKREPEKLQTWAEIALGFATGHLTGQLGEKGKKYYYLILTIFSYIFVTNIIGLIPKPWFIKPYTPTANINVTFAMALCVFFITQYQGIRRHGFKYAKAFMTPSGVPKGLGYPMNLIFVPVHVMGEVFKPLSLSVRLFANTLAGHLIILVMMGLFLQYAHTVVIPGLTGIFVLVMMGFEIFIAFIQAYIFSLLSVVYIESAIYAGH